MAKDEVKNINVGQCVGTIFACLFACLIVFVPFHFGSTSVLYKDVMPIIGDGSAQITHLDMTTTFFETFNLNYSTILELLSQYVPYVFFGILAVDIVMALLLIIFQATFLRVIFKIISIIFGFAMLGVALYYLIYIAGFIIPCLNLTEPFDFMSYLDTSGVLVALVMVIFGFMFMGKQFKWFAKLY